MEHYLIIDGEEMPDGAPIKKKRTPYRKRQLVTRDNTLYRLTIKKAELTPGSFMLKVLNEIGTIVNKDPTRSFTRKQITDRLGKDNNVMSAIANLREGGYIKIVES